MGLFDGLFGATNVNPAATPAAPEGNATPQTGIGGMQLASFLGMLAGAMGGQNSAGGRVGQGVQQAANGQMMAASLLEREKGNRDFLKKLLDSHNKLSDETAAQIGTQTPEQLGGGISSWFTGGK